MNISNKTEYACLALLELAVHYGRGEPVRLRQIAEKHGIPSPFLVQILAPLKRSGLVASVRGAAGGYRLARPPREVTLGEILALVEGPPAAPAPAAGSVLSSVLHDVWQQVQRVQAATLASVTLADLVERAAARGERMYYI